MSNRDVRGGLALICVAGIFGLLWLMTRTADGQAVETAAALGATLALLLAAAGLFVVARALLRD